MTETIFLKSFSVRNILSSYIVMLLFCRNIGIVTDKGSYEELKIGTLIKSFKVIPGFRFIRKQHG